MATKWAALAATMLALAGAATAIPIPILSQIIAGTFLLAATVFAGFAIYFAVQAANLNREVTELEEELVAAREAFDKAVADVMANCPQECWGPLDQPPC
jgi:hypothetical protein